MVMHFAKTTAANLFFIVKFNNSSVMGFLLL